MSWRERPPVQLESNLNMGLHVMEYETKHYSDGTSATGVAPLPDLSPAQQDAANGTIWWTDATMPRDPTEAMLNAARDWSYKKYGKPIGHDAATGCWQAMFDAQANRS